MSDATANLILNVDDNDGARYAKSRILSRAGFVVIEAANGTEALERARDSLPDLVLLDVKLPDINGFEVCRQIKATPETARHSGAADLRGGGAEHRQDQRARRRRG